MDEPENPTDPGDIFDSLFKQTRPGDRQDIDDHESFVTWHEVIIDESSGLIRIVKHNGENTWEEYSLHTKCRLRLKQEAHEPDEDIHLYQFELIDPRYFTTPLVFEAAFDNEGRPIEPETE